ncbi:hypothetical protein PCC79_16505 [Propioniciclava soli]|uniref:Restriction endonuclease n=1 Tax=Propioniciclava soli TaxID=2775081 RepID=A0ABZ3C6S5_9ACTN
MLSRVENPMEAALKGCGQKPLDTDTQANKKNYNERVSAAVALALAEELRQRGMAEARPSGPGVVGSSGAERRLAGGIGAKKVDVTWATEESGLILAVSVKTILFKDARSGNYQKNLTNRRADMLNEAVTLHRRFPYAVLGGFLILDAGSENDGTARRRSTFLNVGPRFRLFTGRQDPAGRDEQYEKFYVVLVDLNVFQPTVRVFEVNDLENEVSLDQMFDDLITLVGERNFDFYEGLNGQVTKL